MSGRLVVSLDFELHWGVRDHTPVERYRDDLLGMRGAIPALLELFTEYEIHATWAAVGFLFARDRAELEGALPARRPRYARAALDPYRALDGEVGHDERDDPLHFAASQLEQIAGTPHQEVASHTFSHFYCLEDGQDESMFAEDLRAAHRIAARRGLTLRSLVFPRNQVNRNYLEACRRAGFIAYRGSARSWLYDPRAEGRESWLRRGARLLDAYLPLSGDNSYALTRGTAQAPLEVPASRFLRPWSPGLCALEPLRARRIVRGLSRAAESGRIYHLWWHPHYFAKHLDENLEFLRGILRHFVALRSTCGMRSANMRELAEELGVKGAA